MLRTITLIFILGFFNCFVLFFCLYIFGPQFFVESLFKISFSLVLTNCSVFWIFRELVFDDFFRNQNLFRQGFLGIFFNFFVNRLLHFEEILNLLFDLLFFHLPVRRVDQLQLLPV